MTTKEMTDHMTLCLRGHDLDWREIDDEIVVLDVRDATYLGVWGSGAMLWRLLADSTTRDGLVDALVETYEIDEVRAAGDVDEFLATLNDRGLLAS
jgi:Coenzyme PQQ synthesis protein D (PqqD)